MTIKKNWEGKSVKLMQLNDDGFPEREVKEGDEVVTFEGEVWVVTPGVGAPPHKPASTGRIWVSTPKRDEDGDWTREFFPGVFNCKWVEV